MIAAWICLPVWATGEDSTVFFVSGQGNDAWSGCLAAPNADSSDGPFATLHRARDEIRAIRNSRTP
ncbi:MAG TPA: hypothetical protein PLG59_09305, partial [bacterium]|nr:hypothetical protein [bacterium]